MPARASFAFMFGSSFAYLENFNLIHEDNKEGILESIEVIRELNQQIGIGIRLKIICKKNSIIIEWENSVSIC